MVPWSPAKRAQDAASKFPFDNSDREWSNKCSQFALTAKEKVGGCRGNKYRGGTSDATTPSSHILSLFMMSFDDFLSSKTAIFVVRK